MSLQQNSPPEDGFMHIISTMLDHLQRFLFPGLEEDHGSLTAKHKKLVTLLEVIRIEDFVPAPIWGVRGNPEDDRRPVARAFVAKAVFNFPTTRVLLDQLRTCPVLRRICGWERAGEVPSESTFSRAFAEFAASGLPQRVHENLNKTHFSDCLVENISRDSTAIKAREKMTKPVRKQEKVKVHRRPGRPKRGEEAPPKEPKRLERQVGMSLAEMIRDLPTACDLGAKKNSQGYTENWRGYKFHVDWADGKYPVSCLLTSASLHDSQAAIPLMTMTSGRVTYFYDLMDAAYDARLIDEQSRFLGHVPIIDRNTRGGVKPEMDPAKVLRYKQRTNAERGNAGLKDDFGARQVRVRGAAKVAAHLMFGILALAASQLIRWATAT
jgi:hypothetical protein